MNPFMALCLYLSKRFYDQECPRVINPPDEHALRERCAQQKWELENDVFLYDGKWYMWGYNGYGERVSEPLTYNNEYCTTVEQAKLALKEIDDALL